MYKAKKNYVTHRCSLEFKCCVGTSSDGSAVIVGKRSGVITQVNQLAPECKLMLCWLFKERPASKVSQLNWTLYIVSSNIVNYVKANGLKPRLLRVSNRERRWSRTRILNVDVARLLRGKVLSRTSESRLVFCRVRDQGGPDFLKTWIRQPDFFVCPCCLSYLNASMSESNVLFNGRLDGRPKNKS